MTILLDQSAIYAELNPTIKRYLMAEKPVEVLQEVDSTQRYLKEKLKSLSSPQASPPNKGSSLVVAESQLSGKGRMNRDWHASPGGNILFSCSWVYDSIPKDLAALSLALIVSVAERLVNNFDLPVTIKWPNDLLVASKKIAGLLVDVETGGQCRIVVGLGLNVAQTFEDEFIEEAFNEEIWTDLSQHDVVIDRNKMIAAIFSDWVQVFANYQQQGFASFQNRWNELSEHKGKPVVLSKQGQLPAEHITGIMEGVDQNGFLLIRSKDGVHEISDSSYSLRLL